MNQEKKYIELIENYIRNNYKENFREPSANLPYPYLVPGSCYARQLWDWDSWLTGVALLDYGDDVLPYEKGCVLNFLESMDEEGRIPILVQENPWDLFALKKGEEKNIHKPCLALHALAISKETNDASWLKNYFPKIKKFLSYYENNQLDKESGLFYWINDLGLGFDNDPTVFYRPNKSTGAIYLNSLMYGELKAVSEIASMLGENLDATIYKKKADALAKSIHHECFDNKDGYFYSVDLSLRKIDKNTFLHSGCPRFWKSLPLRIETWAGMLPLYFNIATKEEAKRCIKEHYLDANGLNSPFGIRSVSKKEKMFVNMASSNPSCWLGPIWINANYFAYVALKNYGYEKEAKELALKTINLLGKDLEKQGCFTEYYNSETGEGITNKGFQSWNFLVHLMIKDLQN